MFYQIPLEIRASCQSEEKAMGGGGGTVLSSKLQQRRVECKGLGMRAGQERSVAWRSLQGGGEN